MSCRPWLAACVALTAACTVEGPELREVRAQARQEIVLASLTPAELSPEEAAFRWDLVRKPDASIAKSPDSTAGVARFTPDRRGVYVIERWVAYGLGDRQTHDFVIVADGLRPIATAYVPSIAVVGTPLTVESTASRSDEQLPLTYAWRLASRPRGSDATLAVTDSPTTSFVPDVPGAYEVELLVFDGDLWSEPHVVGATAASP